MKFNSESIFHAKVSAPEGVDPTLPTEYEFVANLLNRQDEVLAGLDDLNERVLAAIDELTVTRQAESLAINPEATGEDNVVDTPSEVSKVQAPLKKPLNEAAFLTKLFNEGVLLLR